MRCVKCGEIIPDNSIYCLFCGKKQITQKKQKSRSRRGQGSVTYHKGHKKYYARISNNGEKISLGYFSSEAEAWSAIDKALKDDVSTTSYTWTVADCYEKWSNLHYPTISKSGISSYKNAWRYFAPIKSMKMHDVKTMHLQKCINLGAEKFSRTVCEKIKSLASQLCKFAMQEDIINKNYAEFVKLPPAAKSEIHPFTDDEIETLLKNDHNDTVKIVLILIYTGFRPSEFLSLEVKNIDIENWFVRGGSKTEAGKNRIVPISKKIQSYVKYFYDIALKNNQKYLISNNSGGKVDLNNFRKRYFYPTLEKIGILKDENDRHITPYSTRHTFATLCDRADIDDNLIIRMIGHTTKLTTDKFYIHKTEKDMKKAIESI